MGFFSTDKASSGANQRGFSKKSKNTVNSKTREVKSLQKQVNNKTSRASKNDGKGKR